MKTIRLSLYFVVGLMLGGYTVLSHADYPAGHLWTNTSLRVFDYPTADAACRALSSAYTSFSLGAGSAGRYKCYAQDIESGVWNYDSGDYAIWNSPNPDYCPNGGTLSGSTCVVTCPAGQVLGADGYTCSLPKCPMYPGDASTPMQQPSSCGCPAGAKWMAGMGCRKDCGGVWKAGDDVNAG